MKKHINQITLILADIICIYLAIFIALLLRFDGNIPLQYQRMAVIHGIYISAILIILFFVFRLYSNLWKYTGFRELLKLIGVSILGMFVVILINIILPVRLPLSALLDATINLILLIGGVRIFFRIAKNRYEIFLKNNSSSKRVMIIGAGDAGSIILRELLFNSGSMSIPVVVVDDDIKKLGMKIHGIRIEGGRNKIPELVKKYNIYEIIFAIPSLNIENRRKILQICSQTRCNLKIMPLLSEIQDYNNLSNSLRKVKIEDLLGRKEVNLNVQSIAEYIRNKVILITGGGGSIGSEIARQAIKFNPKKLIILDIYENSVARLLDELRIKYSSITEVEVIIGSILDTSKLENVFLLNTPDVVFHAAAYKHVPLMEANPEEAVKNNVLGTLNTAQ
ncbi:MAG: polysaccharide biosynthesis protein, partial [Actinomycetia bacterium]|nr:polysaccharide biosynthesis protein [Actinomycetes bacterium]